MEKYNLNLASEYAVASQLLLRGLFATVTYGNKKSMDVLAVGENRRAAVIEVKGTQKQKVVTGYYQKFPKPNTPRPDFWVLYSVAPDDRRFRQRFFVLSDQELATVQAKVNGKGVQLTYQEAAKLAAKGVDNVPLSQVVEFEDSWEKIEQFCGGGDPFQFNRTRRAKGVRA